MQEEMDEEIERIPANDMYPWDLREDYNPCDPIKFFSRNKPVYALRWPEAGQCYVADITCADVDRPFEDGENAVLHVMDENWERRYLGTYTLDGAMQHAQEYTDQWTHNDLSRLGVALGRIEQFIAKAKFHDIEQDQGYEF